MTVPGSTSNLGSGFDALSAAVSLYLRVEAEWRADSGVRWPRDWTLPAADNAILRGLERGLTELGRPLPGLEFRVVNEIPLQRGLGSSGAAFVAGLRLAEVLAGESLGDQRLLELAYELEGHPDNVAASLLGGWVLSWTEGARVRAIRLPARLDCRFVAVIPETMVSTSEARAILPRSYSLEDAVFNLQRSALLVYALMEGRGELMAEATRDRLHQAYRARLIPGAAELLERKELPSALGESLLALTISGSGSTMLAVVREAEAAPGIGAWMVETLARAGLRSEVRFLEPAARGAVVEEPEAPGEAEDGA
ncbi:MAG: homoserine kinase [Acidobacteriota bacterium]